MSPVQSVNHVPGLYRMPSNTRVQRTRSSPSALRSLLTRRPLDRARENSPIKHIVVIQVERALPLVSPAYDSGATEEEVRGRWQDYWRSIEHGDSTPTGE